MSEPKNIEAWVAKAKNGDSEAMEMLVQSYLRAAYAVALAVLGRPSDAEDTAQDAFLLAFEKLDTCREDAKFGAWLLQIVRNQARNRVVRRRYRDVPKEAATVETPDLRTLNTAGMRKDLLRALSLLTPPQREVVLLHDLEGWTHKEIGETLGISEVMSRQHLFFARREIRAALTGEEKRGVL